MGWQHRDYAQDEYEWRPGGNAGPGNFLRNLSVTWWLIIINVAVAFVSMSGSAFGDAVRTFGEMQGEAVMSGQIWRLLTATYLHADVGHLFFNMLGLFFFGRAVEQVWGGKQFFVVYTFGGIVGTVIYTLVALTGFVSMQVPLLGASGSVLTILGATAVLFPRAQVLLFFAIPMQIRVLVAIYTVLYVMNLFTRGQNHGGDLVHLVGLGVGMWWAHTGGLPIFKRGGRGGGGPGWLSGLFGKRGGGGRSPNAGAWERKLAQRQRDEAIIDRILKKVHEEGLQSLSGRERRELEQARRRRQEADRTLSGAERE